MSKTETKSETQTTTDEQAHDFELQAAEKQGGLISEFWFFLKTNKKWWLTPILLVLVLFGVLLALGGGPLAPFIYPLF